MRRLALDAATVGVTVALLVALALPARAILGAARPDQLALPPALRVEQPARTFGVYVDPWHVDDWARDVGAAPTLVAKFEAFSRDRPLEPFLEQARRIGMREVLLSWEPWRPVPSRLGVAAGSAPQLGYRSGDIAGGVQDRYIRRVARSVARFPGLVWVRYAHEMNGFWYPWSHGPVAYKRAWRRIVTLFRLEHADNARFVFSVNANLYEDQPTWWRGVQRYWPGHEWVDAIGSTVINFGGRKHYTVQRFAPRLRALHSGFGLPVLLTEVNVDRAARMWWLRDLRHMLAGMPWIRSVAWSQLPSRGRAHQMGTGELDWDIRRDPGSAALLREIATDGSRPPGR